METRMLALMIVGRSFERAHHAFVLAAGALALGRDVVVFGGGLGVTALCRDWSRLNEAALDREFQEGGVVGFEALRDAVSSLGGDLMACEAGMKAAGLTEAALCDGVRVCGVTSFLERTLGAQILSL